MGTLALIFRDSMIIGGTERFLLIFPLCLAIAVVYKATRVEDLSKLVHAVVPLWLTIVAGMYLVGACLWGIFTVMTTS